MQAGLSLKCVVCEQISFAPDNYAGFYDSLLAGLFWISTQISCAGPVESLHVLDHIGDH